MDMNRDRMKKMILFTIGVTAVAGLSAGIAMICQTQRKRKFEKRIIYY